MDEAQFEFVEDEREQIRKQKLLGDFGKNFHGYIRLDKLSDYQIENQA